MPIGRHAPCLLAIGLLAASCTGGPRGTRTLTFVPGSTYYSPRDNFSLSAPWLSTPGTQAVERTPDNDTVDVEFYDDVSAVLLVVQSKRIGGDDPVADARRARALADRFLADTVLPDLAKRYPGTAVVRRAAGVDSPAGPATFLVVRLPAVAAQPDSPPPPAAVRGLLVFPRQGWTYVVGVQRRPADADGQLLADLRRAVGQLTFN